jgi:hypothetical protein
LELPVHVIILFFFFYRFSLITMLGFMVVLAYLVAVASEFLCSHWEWKGI